MIKHIGTAVFVLALLFAQSAALEASESSDLQAFEYEIEVRLLFI